MESRKSGFEFFIRIILATAVLVQYLAMPFSLYAADNSTPIAPQQSPKEQVQALRQRSDETDEAYLERISASQPDLVQNAAMVAVQEALNGTLSDDESLESVVIEQIDSVIEDALADPDLGAEPKSSIPTDYNYDPDQVYGWGAQSFDADGNVAGAWAMQADLDDDIDRAAFEESFETRMQARMGVSESDEETGEPVVEPDPINPNTDAPESFDPFAETVSVPETPAPQTIAPAAVVEPQPDAATPPQQIEEPEQPLDLGANIEPVEPYQSVEGDPPELIVVDTQPHFPELAEGEEPQMPVGLPDAVEAPDNLNELMAREPVELTEEEQATLEEYESDFSYLEESLEENAIAASNASAVNCVLYVNDNAPGANNGSDWHNAYINLDTALSQANSCKGSGLAQIHVATGTYYPATSFNVTDRVQLFGGYSDDGSVADTNAYPTVLRANGANNAVTFAASAGPSTIIISRDTLLHGFTVIAPSKTAIACTMNVSYLSSVATLCSPTIRYVVAAESSIGIEVKPVSSIWNADQKLEPNIHDVTLRNNGTGIAVTGATTNVTINNATIHNNHRGASVQGSAKLTMGANTVHDNGNNTIDGAAVQVGTGSELRVAWSTFYNNTGAAVGAIDHRGNFVELVGSSFINNTSSVDGGAIAHFGGSLKIYNTLFANNTAPYGGAIYTTGHGQTSLAHVTFVKNRASVRGGAVYNSDGADAGSSGEKTIENAIFKDNWSDTNEGHHIYNRGASDIQLKSILAATDSNSMYVGPDTGCGVYNNTICPITIEDAFDADPMFIDPDGADNVLGTLDDNYRLRPGSPVIDRGGHHWIASEPAANTDRDNKARIDDPNFANTHDQFPDLGAYEFFDHSCGQPYGIMFDPAVVDDQQQSGYSWAHAINSWHYATYLGGLCSKDIWMKGGVYTPGGSATDTFSLGQNVRIAGGFLGDDANPSAQNGETHPTILTGDINGDDVRDGRGVTPDHNNIRGTNSTHVVTLTGSNNGLLDNIIVTGGHAVNDNGAGIYCNGCNSTIKGVQLVGNSAAGVGGGLFINASGITASPTIQNSTFSNNYAFGGGGMYINSDDGGTSSPTLSNVHFISNQARDHGGGAWVNANGGVGDVFSFFTPSTASPTLSGGIFNNNTAQAHGGGLFFIATNGANASPRLTSVNFLNNSAAGTGGALASHISVEDASNPSTIAPTLQQVHMLGNSANEGGAIFHTSYGTHADASPSVMTILNSTIANNTGNAGGGVYNRAGGAGNVTIQNSIIANNISNGGSGHQIFNNQSGTVNVNYSLLPSSTRVDAYAENGTITYGEGVLFSDPLFVDADGVDNVVGNGDDNLRLAPGSLAIDSGDSDYLNGPNDQPLITFDLAGAGRFYDDAGVPDRGTGGAGDGIVDMGAFEHQANSCTGFNGIAYVTPTGSGNHSGTSWVNATSNLNQAIALDYACNEINEVRVAGGVYTPGRTAGYTFRLLPEVKVYGGYDGSGATPDNRDYAPPTVLSGDIGNDDVNKDGNGVTTTYGNIQGKNSVRVVTIGDLGSVSYIDTETVLDGLVITGGDAQDGENGGGILCDGNFGRTCSPSLTNLQIVGNRAFGLGGGLFIAAANGTASPAIANSTFSNNYAYGGGGMYINSDAGGTSNPTLTTVHFTGNQARDHGGGAWINANAGATATPLLVGGSFSNNTAQAHGGGLFVIATNSGNASPRLISTHFVNNSAAGTGGALAAHVSVENATTPATVAPRLEQMRMIGNSANEGGAIFHTSYGTHADASPSMMTILNSTIAHNTANAGGGVYNRAGGAGNVTLRNTILTSNTANGGSGHQIFNNESGTVNVEYSLLTSNTASDVHVASGAVNYGANVLFGDPDFVDADGADNVAGNADDDLQLQRGSIAIDTGNTAYLDDIGIEHDLSGNPRTMGAFVDMGVYEFTPWVTIPTLGNAINDVAVASDGVLYVAESAGNYVANFNGTNWAMLGGLNAPAHTLHFATDGGTLYAGGDFTDGVARWTGSGWAAVGNGLPAGTVHDIIQDDSGTLYAGGDFGVQMLNGGAWQAVGSLDNVRTLAFYNGALYAGGNFTSPDPGYFAQWNGSAWQGLTDANYPGGLGATVNALAVYGGKLAIGGEFAAAGNGVFFWDGAEYSQPFTITHNDPTKTNVLGFDVSGPSLAIVGDFDKANNDLAFDFAVWTGGSFMMGLGGLYDEGAIQSVAFAGDDLYVGGNFARIGGRETPNVGLLSSEVVDLSVTLTAPSEITWPTNTQITLVTRNDDSAAIADATMGVLLPDGFTFVSGDGDCAANGSVVSCSVGTLQPNESTTRNITLAVATGKATSTEVLRAFAASHGSFDRTPDNNEAEQSIDLSVDPSVLTELSISLDTDVELVDYEADMTFTTVVTNTGTGAGRDVHVMFTLPNGGIYKSATNGVNCSAAGGNVIACDINQVDPNTTTSFGIVVQMNGNGRTRAHATVVDQSTDPQTYDEDESNNSATSPDVIVFSENRVVRRIGNVVVAANSFVTENGRVTALGGVEISQFSAASFQYQLTGASDTVTWLESVEAGGAPPSGEPALSGSGTLHHIDNDWTLFSGSFTIPDHQNDRHIVAGNDTTSPIDTLHGFAVVSGPTFTRVPLGSGLIDATATIQIDVPGLNMTAAVTGQFDVFGKFDGTLNNLALDVASFTITATSARLFDADPLESQEDGQIFAEDVTLTLDSTMGGGSVTVDGLRIRPNGISLYNITTAGNRTPSIALPDIKIDNGSVINISEVTGKLGFFGGSYTASADGFVNINLPDNNLPEIPASFIIGDNGSFNGSLDRSISIDIGGATVNMHTITLNQLGLSTNKATVALPTVLSKAKAKVKSAAITKDGLNLNSTAGNKVRLPNIRFGSKIHLNSMSATVDIQVENGQASYSFLIDGLLTVISPKKVIHRPFTAGLVDGKLNGSLQGAPLVFEMGGVKLTVKNPKLADNAISADLVRLQLPEMLGGNAIDVTKFSIGEKGIKIGEVGIEYPLPDFNYAAEGDDAPPVTISATDAWLRIGISTDGRSASFRVRATLKIEVGTDSASVTGSLTVNTKGDVTGTVKAFKLSVAGVTVGVKEAKIKNGIVTAKEVSIGVPPQFGGITATAYDLKAGNGRFSIGGGWIQLPEIKLGSVILSVGGGFREDPNNPGRMIIRAEGLFMMENFDTSETPGCNGIEVALEIYVDTNRGMVMDVMPQAEKEINSPERDLALAQGRAISGMGLREVTIAAKCRIPIYATGFSLTEVRGSLTLQAGVTRIELSVTIESDVKVLGVPAIRSRPTLGVEGNSDYMQIDFAAAVEIFSIFTAARIEAKLRIGQKSPGDPDTYFSARLNIQQVFMKGEAHITTWTQDGSFHLVGGGSLSVGVRKGEIASICVDLPWPAGDFCADIPPFEYYRSASVAFGEFHAGSGTTWGAKAEVEFSVDLKIYSKSFKFGVYVDARGKIAFGNVSRYQTITPPDISRAIQLRRDMQYGRMRGVLSDADQALLDDYRTVNNDTYIDFTVGKGDVIVNFIHVLNDPNLEMRFIRPDGAEFTLDNLPANMATTDMSLEAEPGTAGEGGEELEVVQTIVVMEGVEAGEWQVKLIGGENPEYDYIIDILGSVAGPDLAELSVEQVDDTHADVTWAVNSTVPTTTVNIHATAGPITTTQIITDENDVSQTVVVDQFGGAPIALNVDTTLDGTTQTAQIDFSNWESGEYWVWVEAADDLNMPTRAYAPGKVIVEHPWDNTWTANTVISPTYRSLEIYWDAHSSKDVDKYVVYITPDGENFLSEDTIVREVGGGQSTFLRTLDAGKSYAVKVVGVDRDTGRESHSEIAYTAAGGAPFSVAANPAELTLQSGQSGTIDLTLTADEEPFPARVAVDIESFDEFVSADVTTDVLTPTLAGVTTQVNVDVADVAAGGLHTVTVRTSAGGDEQLIDIPVTVLGPNFELRSSEATLTLTEGISTSVEIDAIYENGESDDIILFVDDMPDGLDAEFVSNQIGVGEKATLILTDTLLLTNGTYTITVLGTDGELDRTLDLTLVINKPTFELNSVESTDAQATHNSTVRYTMRLEGDGWDTPINVGVDSGSLSGFITPTIVLPARALITPPATFDVEVEVGNATDVPASVYEMILTATGNGKTEQLPLQLTIVEDNTQPDMQVQVSLSGNEVNAGDLLTVTTRYDNRGTAAASTDLDSGYSHTRTVTATEPLLIPVNIVGCDDLIAGTDTNGFDGDYRCDAFGTLQPGESHTVQTVYRVHESASDGTVAAISELVATPNDFDASDNAWRAEIIVRNTSDVDVALSASDMTQNAGESVTYTASVGTNGNADATGATVTFTPDALMSVQSSSDGCEVADDGSVTCQVGAMASGCGRATASDTFTCDAGSATTQERFVTVLIDAAATENVSMNVAVVGTLVDSDTSNNGDSMTTAVTTQSALNPALTTHVETSDEGGTHSHTLVVTNDGPSVARNVTISYTLPEAASYATLTVNDNDADKNNPEIVSGLELAPNESVTVTMDIVHMQDTAGAFVDSTIEVSANDEATQAVTLRRQVNNVAPTVGFSTPSIIVREGESVRVTAVASDTNPLDQASADWSVDWDLDNDGQYDDQNGNVIVFDATDLDGVVAEQRLVAPQLGVQVTDGSDSSAATQTVTVLNVPPTVDAGEDQQTLLADGFTIDATFTDPAAADTHIAVVKWGDGSQDDATIANNTVQATHTYDVLGEYEAEVCVKDDDGGEGCDTVVLYASCIEHGLVARTLSYRFDNRKLIATTQLEYIGSRLPTPLPSNVALTMYNGETAIDTVTVANAFAANFSQQVEFEWDMVPHDAYTLTVELDDDGAGNRPLGLCVSGAPDEQADTGTVQQEAPAIGESKIYGPTQMTVKRNGGTNPGAITVTKKLENTPDDDLLDAMWSVVADEEENLDVDLTICWTDDDLNANQQANELNLSIYHRHEPTDHWSALLTDIDAAANCATATVTQFSDFMVGLSAPTAVTLEYFTVRSEEGGTVTVDWKTASEINHAGFNLYRRPADNRAAAWEPVNDRLIASNGTQAQGSIYQFTDTAVPEGTWTYLLEDVETDGDTYRHTMMIADVTVQSPTSVQLVHNKAGTVSSTLPLVAMVLLWMTGLYVWRDRRRDRHLSHTQRKS